MTKAADRDGDGYISVDEVEKLLINIGAKEALSPEEIAEVLKEVGAYEEKKGVPVNAVIDYVKGVVKPWMS